MMDSQKQSSKGEERMPTNVAVWTDSRNYVMSKGKIIAEGAADELMADERIRKVYLGL